LVGWPGWARLLLRGKGRFRAAHPGEVCGFEFSAVAGGALSYDAAVVEQVPSIGNREGAPCLLLDQKDREPVVVGRIANRSEQPADHQGSQTE
jgi:hypothetical protein